MANDELGAIREAWDKESGRDTDLAVSLSDAYVAAHPDEFSEFENLTMDQCVTALGVFRDAEMVESQWRVQAWIFHHFEFQNIGGPIEAKVRVVSV